MKRMKASRNFWADGQIKDPRRIIRRGETFETSEHHAAQLQARGIASPASSSLGAQSTQVIKPEQPAAPVIEANMTPDYETKPFTPEIKELEPEPAPQENDQEPPTIDGEPLDLLTVPKLKQLAKNEKIKGYSDMNKGQLIKALIAAAKGEK